jgi:hypothetical protein
MDISGYFIAPNTSGLAFYPVAPCRVSDTRGGNGTFGGPAMAPGSTRTIPIPAGSCNIPSTARAYSLNITAIPQSGSLQWLTAWPSGQTQPNVSTLNSYGGAVVANSAIIPDGGTGAINLFATDATHAIIDINGYFAPPGAAGAKVYYPVIPCRLVDTRVGNGAFGGPVMLPGTTRTFALPASACNIPAAAQAYSINATVLPAGILQWLTVWPAGQSQPFVSTLNSYNGKVVANGALVPAGTNGGLSVFVTDTTQVILDINGYFAQ